MTAITPQVAAQMQAKGIRTQQKFVSKRIKSLNNIAEKDGAKLKEIIGNLIYRMEKRFPREDEWGEVYTKICDRLRSADLTMNFKSTNWFRAANNRETYRQMYENNLDKTTGAVKLTDDTFNQADMRAVVDDQVTLPGSWAKKSIFSEKRKIHDRMSFSGSKAPVTSSQAVKSNLGSSEKSTLQHIGTNESGQNSFQTTNPKFNPFAKQVFAALNYGRRPHGASTYYGRSYLVLRPELKKGCLYFGEDTFNQPKGDQKRYMTKTKRDRAGTQSTYDWIGNILLWTNSDMQEAVYQSCFQGHTLEDTSYAGDLLEAHIFSDVRLNRDIEKVVLSVEPNMEGENWMEIQANCYDWARRNNIRVIMNDA
jgi:hypothetical protein